EYIPFPNQQVHRHFACDKTGWKPIHHSTKLYNPRNSRLFKS
ncbi:MAG: hypothetical protein ACI92G_004290, partial [Candidatus Pelagisphaera sp.]